MTENGVKNAILIDLNTLRQQRTTGEAVASYLASLEDIEDIIDVELSSAEPSDDWSTVKTRLKSSGHLSAHV
jgi:hypothetical protein